MLIYLMNLEYVYEYTIKDTLYIQATDIHVIDQHSNQEELTLITCDETGEGRFMVNAEFVKKTLVGQVDKTKVIFLSKLKFT